MLKSEKNKWLIADLLEEKLSSNGSYLSHLIGTTSYYSYDDDRLYALKNYTQKAEFLNEFAELSNLVHQVPKGRVFLKQDGLLWERYGLLLNNQIQLAKNKDEGSTVTHKIPKNLHEKYNQYKNIRDKVQASTKEYFETNDEMKRNEISENLRNLSREWYLDGNKEEIDKYIDKQIGKSDLCYTSRLAIWKSKYNNIFTTSMDSRVFGTEFANFNMNFEKLKDESSWQKIKWDDFRNLGSLSLNDSSGKYLQNIDLLEFEFAILSVERKWFMPDVFSSSFWRLSSKEEIVSDGKNPPKGSISSYVSDVVFIKNFKIIEKKPVFLGGLEWLGKVVSDLFEREQSHETGEADKYHLVGMICQVVPKCPNPDPYLAWP